MLFLGTYFAKTNTHAVNAIGYNFRCEIDYDFFAAIMPLSAVFINIFDNNEYYPRISVTELLNT